MPRSVGPYEILGPLGRGGMATVYLARQPVLGRRVALKELAQFPTGDASLTQRFLREARVAGSLNHPNIVTVYDFLEQDGVPYIAMELFERGSLRPLVRRMSLANAAGVLEGLLAGLSHAQAMGIVHRDIKPENVLVRPDGGIKIADFGIAKAYQQVATDEMLTPAGATLGTPAYMAPEQALAQELGPWTDLYQAGVVAYELLAGAVPFRSDESPMALVMQHINDPVPPLPPGTDPALEAWVRRTLTKDPAGRPPGPREAWEELEEIVVSALGPLWRRDARLASPEPTAEHAAPLTPARFSGASPPPPPPPAPPPEAAPAPTPPPEPPPPPAPPLEAAPAPTPPPEPPPPPTRPPDAAPAPPPPPEAAPEPPPAPERAPEPTPPPEPAPVPTPATLREAEPPSAAPVPVPATAAPRRPWLLAGGAVALALAAVVAIALTRGGADGPGQATPTATATVATTATPSPTPPAAIDVPEGPDGIAAGEGAIWVASSRADSLTRIDPGSGETTSIDVGADPDSVAVEGGSAWVSLSGSDQVAEVSAGAQPEVLETFDVGARPEGIAATSRAMWVANSGDGTVSQIVRRSGEVRTVAGVGGEPVDLAIGAGAVWVALNGDGTVARVDGARRMLAATITGIGPNPRAVAILGRDVWVATASDGRLWRIAADENTVTGSVEVGGAPRGVDTDGEHLWVTDHERNRVVEVDPDRMRVVGREQVAKAPLGVTVDDDAVWVAGFDAGKVTRIAR